jgi:hypothetical protein
MKYIIAFFVLSISSFTCFAQESAEDKMSKQDSVLLENFWITFKAAVKEKDKIKFSSICDFPFSCRQCIDDTTFKHSNPDYINVTQKSFNTNFYQFFFENQVLDFVNRYELPQDFFIFSSFNNDKEKKAGYQFSYLQSHVPGKELAEQAFIYIEKKRGIFKITGTDMIP